MLAVVPSMGRVGCVLDNAAAESYDFTLKVELVYQRHFAPATRHACTSPADRRLLQPDADTEPLTVYCQSSTSNGSWLPRAAAGASGHEANTAQNVSTH
ncbi:hypothetical protein GCM10023194_69320 [Planotetraspora phitsanulokensis]|uniref:Uncharacterized protein n=1 Tax=Planotetraspora phitsanulokensis TaxID=575192 RepID=A0A8J3UIT2_9ACTN|nr:hypothetical protein Pph01_80820 [Planotetraspora phitsanulokensis]